MLNQRENEIKQSFSSTYEEMKSLQTVNINKIASQLNNIQHFECIRSLKTKENHTDVVKYLQECRLREELYKDAISQIEFDECRSKFEFDVSNEIENICKLITSCGPNKKKSRNYEICKSKNAVSSK